MAVGLLVRASVLGAGYKTLVVGWEAWDMIRGAGQEAVVVGWVVVDISRLYGSDAAGDRTGVGRGRRGDGREAVAYATHERT